MNNPKAILLALGSSILGQATTHADFPKPTNTQKTDLTLPTPEEAIKGMRLPGGFRVECFASEPMIRQPIAMAFDDKGRLTVSDQGKAGTFSIEIPKPGQDFDESKIKKLNVKSAQWGMLYAFDHLYMMGNRSFSRAKVLPCLLYTSPSPRD